MAICCRIRSNRRATAGGRGFTIVESLVALTITGVSLLAVIGGLRLANDVTDRLRDAHRAALLAETHMVRLLQDPDSSFGNAQGVEGKFAWKQEVRFGRVEGVAEVVVTVQWPHQGRMLTFELVSLKALGGPDGG